MIEFTFPGIPGYSRKQVTNVIRAESNTLKICEPTIVRVPRRLLQERTYIVHALKRRRLKITPL
jgi:hypothetical protein